MTDTVERQTIGQRLVAKWEALDSPWSEPADLAEAIDKALAAEREQCAKVAEELKASEPMKWIPDSCWALDEVAEAIRARG